MSAITRGAVVVEAATKAVFAVAEIKVFARGPRARLERRLGKDQWVTLDGDMLPGYVLAPEQPASLKWSDIAACMVRVEKVLEK